MNDALDLLARVPRILVFLTALTIVAECASATGVFEAFSQRLVRLGWGQTWAVWSLFMMLTAAVTAFLSLDTTAVLMTSAGVVLARRLHVPVAAFAFPTLWLANIGSLWLPTSNLTNLLARDVMPHPSASAFLRTTWPVALTTTLVPLALAAFIWRRDLTHPATDSADHSADHSPGDADGEPSAMSSHGRVDDPGQATDADPSRARRDVGVVILVMCGAILAVEPAWAATAGALMCLLLLVVFDRPAVRSITLPWRSLAMTTALFAAVAVVHGSGALDPLLEALGRQPMWALGAAGALLANATNNLPSYLALEPVAHGDPTRLLAVLIGINVASGITWWGSVATLLWRERLRRDGVVVTWRTHLRLTGVATLLTTLAAFVVLVLTR